MVANSVNIQKAIELSQMNFMVGKLYLNKSSI